MNLKQCICLLILCSFFSCKKEISNEAIEANNKSLILANSGNKDSIIKAIEIIDKVISKYPKNENFVGSKVNFLCKLQKYKEAYNELLKLKTNIKKDFNFYMLEGLILEKLRKEKMALICYKMGLNHINNKLEKDPTNNSIIIEKYILISVLFSKEEALKQFEIYTKSHPNKDVLEIKNIIISFKKSDLI